MAGHTYVSNLVHCVFSTKNRERSIGADLQPKLWAYLGGIARNNGFKALAIGGTDDHVHMLLSLPANVPISFAMQLIKGGSSKWVHETHDRNFAWQEAYGAFTVGISQEHATIAYINSQADHHKRVDFRAEFLAFLKKHKIDYDPNYVLG